MLKIKQHAQKLYKRLLMQKRRFMPLCIPVFIMLTSAIPVYASGINDSTIVKGTEKLISDVTTWLMMLAPVIAGLLIIYFCIRRSAADELDTKKWNNRIILALMSCIGAVLGSATLNIIIGYYK